jgi:hypothetical protein
VNYILLRDQEEKDWEVIFSFKDFEVNIHLNKNQFISEMGTRDRIE